MEQTTTKAVLAAASFDEQKYFFEPRFLALPQAVQEEVHILCVTLADKLMCTFCMGFLPTGDLYFETVPSSQTVDFDDIGAQLELKAIEREKKELLKALKLWYLVFQTPEGEALKEQLLQQAGREKDGEEQA